MESGHGANRQRRTAPPVESGEDHDESDDQTSDRRPPGRGWWSASRLAGAPAARSARGVLRRMARLPAPQAVPDGVRAGARLRRGAPRGRRRIEPWPVQAGRLAWVRGAGRCRPSGLLGLGRLLAGCPGAASRSVFVRCSGRGRLCRWRRLDQPRVHLQGSALRNVLGRQHVLAGRASGKQGGDQEGGGKGGAHRLRAGHEQAPMITAWPAGEQGKIPTPAIAMFL